MYHQGQNEGLVYGGSLALDGLGAYLVARVWIRDVALFQAVLRTMGYAIAAAGLIALPETLLGQTFTHDILRAITGYTHPTAVETRLGLTRAYGTFDHPIHYGTFCAALLAQFWYATNSTMQRRKRAVLLAGATFLGLSSAPILCLFLQAAMLVWEKLTRGMHNRTALTLTILAGLYIGASAGMTRSPINFIATGMTLDSWTGFYRLRSGSTAFRTDCKSVDRHRPERFDASCGWCHRPSMPSGFRSPCAKVFRESFRFCWGSRCCRAVVGAA
jgi:hypothetical protein